MPTQQLTCGPSSDTERIEPGGLAGGAAYPPVPSDIMIVDDNPANLKLLEEMLLQRGHEARSFPLGRLAIASAIRTPPDLFLLDINMPELNGYEVCERLKAAPALAAIPVIFLSALTETQDKVKAFESGAVDYISKPFQFDEVHARVETHLKLHKLQREMKAHNEHLEDLVSERTRELNEANRRLTILDRSKSEFLNLISHELRTPLNGLLGAGELLIDRLPPVEHDELRGLYKSSRRRILSILDDALLLTEIDVSRERFRSVPVALYPSLHTARERSVPFASCRGVGLDKLEPNLTTVLSDEQLLVKAFHALLETAVRFCDRGECVRLSCGSSFQRSEVIIESSGRSIPPPSLARFFDLFSVEESSTPAGELGLGPPVAFRILSLFGASVRVENREPNGIRFTVSLQTAPESTARPSIDCPGGR